MTDLIKITGVEPLEGRRLRLRFSDGAVKDVDLSGLLSRGGVFARIRDDRSFFEQVRVNSESRTIEWPGDVDLDPDVCMAALSRPPVLRSSGERSPSPQPPSCVGPTIEMSPTRSRFGSRLECDSDRAPS